jgi:lysozyme family protein
MATFDLAQEFTRINEGGFQKVASDPGNYYNGQLLGTNHGISAPVARENGWMGAMEDLPYWYALEIYKRVYWTELDLVQNQAVATKIYDMRVQFGPAGGIKIAQKALQSLGWQIGVDGGLGPLTTEAINRSDAQNLMVTLCAEMERAYRADVAANPSKLEWLAGWITRARRIPPGVIVAVMAMSYGILGALVIGYLVSQT